MNAGGVFGRVAPAWLSDKIGRFNLLCPCSFLAGLSCLVLWMLGKDIVAITVFAVLYGFMSGAFISVVTPCVAQISDIREIGARIGVLYTFISVPYVYFRSSPFSYISHPDTSQIAFRRPGCRRTGATTTRGVHRQHRTCGIKHDTGLGIFIGIEIDD